MRRVLVLGSPGSGKSTFARKLGAVTGLPVVHLDQLYWSEGWVPVASELFTARLDKVLAEPCWIVDGDYVGTLDLRLAHADMVVILQYHRVICLWRIARRLIRHYGRVRPDTAKGCPERVDLDFIRYIWRFPRRNRPLVEAVLDRHDARSKTVIFRRDADAEAFLASLAVR